MGTIGKTMKPIFNNHFIVFDHKNNWSRSGFTFLFQIERHQVRWFISIPNHQWDMAYGWNYEAVCDAF